MFERWIEARYTPTDQQGELSASVNSDFSRIWKETRQPDKVLLQQTY